LFHSQSSKVFMGECSLKALKTASKRYYTVFSESFSIVNVTGNGDRIHHVSPPYS
jgi:hypothetical protein